MGNLRKSKNYWHDYEHIKKGSQNTVIFYIWEG